MACGTCKRIREKLKAGARAVAGVWHPATRSIPNVKPSTRGKINGSAGTKTS